MKSKRMILVTSVVAVLALLSAALLAAQSATVEPTAESTSVPSSFNDNRINGDIFLGGLALYCEDENGSTAGNTFQNGALTVWGSEGQEFIRLTASELRGNMEVEQPDMMATQDMMAGTEEATQMASSSDDVSSMATSEATATMDNPVLLARANTPSGTIWLFSLGNDQFALQGTDNTGKFYTYSWTACGLGSLTTDTAPFNPMEETMMSTQEATEPAMTSTEMPTSATAEATSQS